MALGEFELIERCFRQRSALPDSVIAGIGDDCALLQVPVDSQLAVSMDTLVAGVHFPADASPALIGERALRVNLSDLAAAGAEPLWFTLGLTLPKSDAGWLDEFATGLLRVADQYGIALVGGDTTRGPLAITIQVHGAVPRGGGLLRSRARAGDRIYVTGPLGDGAAALALLQGAPVREPAQREYLLGRYYQPVPQIQAGLHLRQLANAAIDVSDGLLADLGHICRQSGVGARVQLSQLPASSSVLANFDRQQVRQFALSGGDDYQLCFTVAEENVPRLQQLLQRGEMTATAIGEITAAMGLVCVDGDKEVVPGASGFQHFASDD
ncbi:MAG: thiamine-phosphate kinase [Gammaproteobacteria bacterium]|nr:thiamine-phosphate kinase [Gammaproteobacteria bacterium]